MDRASDAPAMLIISRRKGQRIVIGNDLEVIVTDLSRSTVKLGIRAPAHTSVMRGEVRDSIEQANREAALSDLDAALDLSTALELSPSGEAARPAPLPLASARRRSPVGEHASPAVQREPHHSANREAPTERNAEPAAGARRAGAGRPVTPGERLESRGGVIKRGPASRAENRDTSPGKGAEAATERHDEGTGKSPGAHVAGGGRVVKKRRPSSG